jgi:ABC-type multidrug transport system permease subunit
MKIIYELYKNFKIIFRNVSSISLLIIGPLLLILLIGYAFSGDKVHGIQIGIKAADYSTISPFLENFTGIGEIKSYSDIDLCVLDMKKEETHICLEFSDDFASVQEFSQGQIVFYYDNSRKGLSNELIKGINDYLGLTSEQISIESAQTMLGNIETLVVFLDRRNDDLLLLINESVRIRDELLLRKQRLIEFRDDFNPKYASVKEMQTRLDIIAADIDEGYDAFDKDTEDFQDDLDDLEEDVEHLVDDIDQEDYFLYHLGDSYHLSTNVSYLKGHNLSYSLVDWRKLQIVGDNIVFVNASSNRTYTIDPANLDSLDIFGLTLVAFKGRIADVRTSVDTMDRNVTQFHDAIRQQKKEFDDAVELLDTLKILVDEDIKASDEYIAKIELSTLKIQELRKSLSDNLEQLSKLNPSLAEKLIKPILRSYEPLDSDLENIEVSFPTLLTLIVVFISILFANIVTLTELNSKAYLRNLIAPVNDLVFMLGLILTNFFVVMFQVIVLMAVAQMKFKIDMFSIFWPTMLVVTLLSLIFIFIGMIIAYTFNNEQSSILTATFTSLAFFLFSNIVTPLEAMPPLATGIALNSPFVLAQSVFKKLIMYQLPLGISIIELAKLAAYCLLFFFILVLVAKTKNRSRL